MKFTPTSTQYLWKFLTANLPEIPDSFEYDLFTTPTPEGASFNINLSHTGSDDVLAGINLALSDLVVLKAYHDGTIDPITLYNHVTDDTVLNGAELILSVEAVLSLFESTFGGVLDTLADLYDKEPTTLPIHVPESEPEAGPETYTPVSEFLQ